MSRKKHRPNLNQARNMDVDAWRVRQVAARLKIYLAERELAFRREHLSESDGELREYVRRRAKALGRMPHPLELEGGRFLEERLGNWNSLALSLGYRPVRPDRGRQAYLSLREKAEELFREERQARKREKKLRWQCRTGQCSERCADIRSTAAETESVRAPDRQSSGSGANRFLDTCAKQ